MHPLLMMLLAVFSLHLPHYSHSCCLLTLSILYSLKPLPHLFSLNFCAPSTSLSLFLSLPAPHPPTSYFPWRQDRRMLERRMAELEEELKVLVDLKADNQRLKDENGALIRVISKLSK
uniref:cGMP-dependent protein kinase interacting domain-containing protein n=1 Tax=Haplochromis burtoni TaxID=8153 RepID=A0A3Q2VWR7_HAPBU